MMEKKRTDNQRSPGADPSVTALLRATYAAPRDDSYWAALEQRVMSRLHEAPQVLAWWSSFAEWRTAGLIAATLALLLAGGTLVREQSKSASERELAAGAAYDEVFNTAAESEAIAFIGRPSTPDDSAARYLNPLGRYPR